MRSYRVRHNNIVKAKADFRWRVRMQHILHVVESRKQLLLFVKPVAVAACCVMLLMHAYAGFADFAHQGKGECGNEQARSRGIVYFNTCTRF